MSAPLAVPERPPAVLVCCSVFCREVETLRDRHWPGVPVRRVNSMLHMCPGRLAAVVEALLERESARRRRVVLVYGDCAVQMARFEKRPNVVRTAAHNCCELLLGREEYSRLLRQGAFFMLPEWTRRWKEVFSRELGLDQANASGLMGDMHRMLVYLDTGLAAVPEEALLSCSRYCGLPVEIRPVTLEPLRKAIAPFLEAPICTR